MLLALSFFCATLLPVASPAVAMAHDDNGVVLAWAEGGRLHVQRLDGAVQDVATAAYADAPSIAVSPARSGFTLAWLELSGDEARAMFCALDPQLRPSPARELTRMSAQAAMSPLIVRSGASTWLAINNAVWQLRADGSLDLPLDSGFPASDMVADAAFPRLVGATKAVSYTGCMPSCILYSHIFGNYCSPQPGCTFPADAGYALKFVALYSTYASAPFLFSNATQPAIASTGDETLIAWYQPGSLVVNRFADVRDFNIAVGQPLIITALQTPSEVTRPDVATDGERYFVVWSTATHDIDGAAIDGRGNVTHYTIASSAADERNPSVIAIRPGAFLVAYEKIEGTDRRIATRFITFDGRARPVR